MPQRPLIWLFLTRKLSEIWAENGERRKRKLRDLKKKSYLGLDKPCVFNYAIDSCRRNRHGVVSWEDRRQFIDLRIAALRSPAPRHVVARLNERALLRAGRDPCAD